jgi:hypothetical protein
MSSLFFGISEDIVLTGLAQARDGVFLLREGITERGCFTLTGYARSLSDSTHTGYTRELRKHSFDFGVLEGSSEGVLVIFHVCIIPKGRGNVKRKLQDL